MKNNLKVFWAEPKLFYNHFESSFNMTNKSIDYLFVYFNVNRLDEGKNSPEEFLWVTVFKRIGLNSKTIEYKYKFEKRVFYYF